MRTTEGVSYPARFLVVLGVATLVTLIAGATILLGAFLWGDPLSTALDAVNKVFLIGAGLILGLLGGQAG
jgi:hypothetical protein